MLKSPPKLSLHLASESSNTFKFLIIVAETTQIRYVLTGGHNYSDSDDFVHSCTDREFEHYQALRMLCSTSSGMKRGIVFLWVIGSEK